MPRAANAVPAVTHLQMASTLVHSRYAYIGNRAVLAVHMIQSCAPTNLVGADCFMFLVSAGWFWQMQRAMDDLRWLLQEVLWPVLKHQPTCCVFFHVICMHYACGLRCISLSILVVVGLPADVLLLCAVYAGCVISKASIH